MKKKKRIDPAGIPDEADEVIVTTSRGVAIVCHPVAAELETVETNLRASVDWPAVPTRTITDVAGSEMEEELSQAYVDSERATDEEKEAWAEYQAALSQATDELRLKRALAIPRLLALKGISLADPSLEEQWTEEHRWMGVDVPADRRERALHFLTTEILGDAKKDTEKILLGIYRASGQDEEVLNRLEASFRSQMGRAEGDAAGKGAGDTGLPQ